MAGEGDAEHLVGLALVPVGAGVDGEPRLDGHRVVGDVGLQRHADVARDVGHPGEHLEAGLATGDALAHLGAALGRRLGRVVLAAAVRRRHPVDRRQVAEVLEAHRVERLAGLLPRVGGDAHPQVVVGLAARSRRARRRCAGAARRRCPRAARRPGSACVRLGRRASLTQWDHRRRRSARAAGMTSCALAAPLGGHVLVADPLLQQDDALEQRLRPGRAAGHVDVDGDDLVDALGHRVAVPVRAAAVGAAAHRDDVLRLGHLVVEAQDGRRHLVRDRAGDDDEVGLAGAGRQRDDAEAHDVVARARRTPRPSRWRSRPGPTGTPTSSTSGRG